MQLKEIVIPPVYTCSDLNFNYPEAKSEACYLSYVYNPKDFYIGLSSTQATLEKINDLCQSYAAESDVLVEREHVLKGTIWLAHYDEDGAWYRSIVLEAPVNGMVPVAFLDHGNKSEINLATELKFISSELMEFPPIAISCQLMTDMPEKFVMELLDLICSNEYYFRIEVSASTHGYGAVDGLPDSLIIRKIISVDGSFDSIGVDESTQMEPHLGVAVNTESLLQSQDFIHSLDSVCNRNVIQNTCISVDCSAQIDYICTIVEVHASIESEVEEPEFCEMLTTINNGSRDSTDGSNILPDAETIKENENKSENWKERKDPEDSNNSTGSGVLDDETCSSILHADMNSADVEKSNDSKNLDSLSVVSFSNDRDDESEHAEVLEQSENYVIANKIDNAAGLVEPKCSTVLDEDNFALCTDNNTATLELVESSVDIDPCRNSEAVHTEDKIGGSSKFGETNCTDGMIKVNNACTSVNFVMDEISDALDEIEDSGNVGETITTNRLPHVITPDTSDLCGFPVNRALANSLIIQEVNEISTGQFPFAKTENFTTDRTDQLPSASGTPKSTDKATSTNIYPCELQKLISPPYIVEPSEGFGRYALNYSPGRGEPAPMNTGLMEAINSIRKLEETLAKVVRVMDGLIHRVDALEYSLQTAQRRRRDETMEIWNSVVFNILRK